MEIANDLAFQAQAVGVAATFQRDQRARRQDGADELRAIVARDLDRSRYLSRGTYDQVASYTLIDTLMLFMAPILMSLPPLNVTAPVGHVEQHALVGAVRSVE